MIDRLVDVAGSGVLRLVDALPADLARVEPFVGDTAAQEASEPLLTVRFVDRLPTGRRRLVGGQHAVSDGALLMRAGAGWARLPLGDAHAGDELVVERRATEVPHLVDLLNLAALQRGALPLHAAALEIAGNGVLLVGWSKGGKTEALLATMATPGSAARLVGDQWIHLDSSLVARPLGYRMRLWAWQLAQAPDVSDRLTRSERRRLRVVGLARRWAPGALQSALERRHGTYLQPEAVFPGRLVAQTTVSRVTLMESHSSEDVCASPIDADDLVARVSASSRYERRGLLESYEVLRYGLPGVRDQRLDTAAELELRLMRERLGGVPAQVVAHPYPVRLERLVGLV